MILKYTNSFEDLIEAHLFLNSTIKIRSFLLKFSKYVIYGYYLLCALGIFCVANKSPYDTKRIIGVCVIAIGGSIVLHITRYLANKLVNKYESKFRLKCFTKECNIAVEKNPNLVAPREVNLKSNKIIVTVNNSQKEIHSKSISKVLENNKKIYILSGHSILLIIPYEAFNDDECKNSFLEVIYKI